MAILSTASVSKVKKKNKVLHLLVSDFFATCQAINAEVLLALAAKPLKYNVPPPAG